MTKAPIAILGGSAALVAALALVARPAVAVDGAIEINQARALAGDVTGTGGDLPGFPVTLDVTGSYVLTGDLGVPPFVNAIEITASDVHIDLHGFTIASVLGPIAPGAGVTDLSPDGGVTVVDGTVRGFGGGGILLGDRARVERVNVFDNGASGISLGTAGMVVKSHVRGTVVSGGTGDGIRCIQKCKIENNVSTLNEGFGIVVIFAGTILANTAVGNGLGGAGGGIAVGDGSTVGDNTADANTGPGITGFGGAGRVVGNTAMYNTTDGISMAGPAAINDNTVVYNSGNGIACPFTPCNVNENTATGNGLNGILAGDGSALNHNMASYNGTNGLSCGLGCNVNGNTAYSNTALGLLLPAASPPGVYRDNALVGNLGGDVAPFFLDVLSPAQSNTCSGLVPCP
jgi:hypothetical protein